MDPLPLVLLLLFWLLFFRNVFFINPWVYATSEPLDTAFPSSRILGEWYRRGCRGEVDPYYYPHYTGIPFLSSFYPPHVLMSVVGSCLPLDVHWVLYCLTMTLHFLWASVGAYLLFSGYPVLVALFGALTFAYMGYSVKQNSCINYTVAWTPWVLLGAFTHNPWVMGVSLGMGCLSGYWALWIYLPFFSAAVWLSR